MLIPSVCTMSEEEDQVQWRHWGWTRLFELSKFRKHELSVLAGELVVFGFLGMQIQGRGLT